MGTLLSPWIECPTSISSNHPISLLLLDEVHKLLENSGSDWPTYAIFSGNDLWVKAIKFMHMAACCIYWIVGTRIWRLHGCGKNEHILYFWPLDPQMVDSSMLFTKYVSEWFTDLRAISSNIGVTTVHCCTRCIGIWCPLKQILICFFSWTPTSIWGSFGCWL